MTFEEILGALTSRRVLIIGDVMLDRFVYGRVERISPEAPTPVITATDEVELLGGAGNVASNVASLGAVCTLIGVIGRDASGARITEILKESGRIENRLVLVSDRPTTTKIRFVSPLHNTHLLRADWEVVESIKDDVVSSILKEIGARIADSDIVIISDYAKGVICSKVISYVMSISRNLGKPVIVDPKGNNYERYSGALAITPNLNELSDAVGRKVSQTDDDVHQAAVDLLALTNVRAILVKRGAHGVQLVHKSGKDTVESIVFPASARRVVDVSGAGDTSIATFALALVEQPSLAQAAYICNVAAGIVVGKPGTARLDMKELSDALIPRFISPTPKKFESDLNEAARIVERWKDQGLAVGFANGCFDLLHPGHIALLSAAKQKVDRLVVALNSDASVRRLKGSTRPIQSEKARVAIMAAIEVVDLVVLFEEDTPYELIKLIKPHVIFKGSDYRIEQVVGRDIVEKFGGRVELIDLVPNESTSRLASSI